MDGGEDNSSEIKGLSWEAVKHIDTLLPKRFHLLHQRLKENINIDARMLGSLYKDGQQKIFFSSGITMYAGCTSSRSLAM